ncbi:MAG: SMI1/KNR4 family protein [Sandaracinaceae bacterium]
MYRQNETELRRAIDRIERWFREHVDDAYFAPGTTDAAGPLGPVLARWNGQREERVPFFEAFYLLDAGACAREKAMMDGLARSEGWPATWWDPDWLPFASDHAGQLLVLEIRSGAVIEFLHDDEPRPVHAETLEAFLTKYADDLESDRRALRDGYIVDLEEHAARVARQREREKVREREGSPAARTLILVGVAIAVLITMLLIGLAR